MNTPVWRASETHTQQNLRRRRSSMPPDNSKRTTSSHMSSSTEYAQVIKMLGNGRLEAMVCPFRPSPNYQQANKYSDFFPAFSASTVSSASVSSVASFARRSGSTTVTSFLSPSVSTRTRRVMLSSSTLQTRPVLCTFFFSPLPLLPVSNSLLTICSPINRKAYGELPDTAKINETDTFGPNEDGDCGFEFDEDRDSEDEEGAEAGGKTVDIDDI